MVLARAHFTLLQIYIWDLLSLNWRFHKGRNTCKKTSDYGPYQADSKKAIQHVCILFSPFLSLPPSQSRDSQTSKIRRFILDSERTWPSRKLGFPLAPTRGAPLCRPALTLSTLQLSLPALFLPQNHTFTPSKQSDQVNYNARWALWCCPVLPWPFHELLQEERSTKEKRPLRWIAPYLVATNLPFCSIPNQKSSPSLLDKLVFKSGA